MLRSMTIHNSLFSRRTFVVGSIIPLIAGCSSKNTVENAAETRFIAAPTGTPHSDDASPTAAVDSPEPAEPPVSKNPIAKPHPWKDIQYRLAGEGHYVAWTVDDGANPETVRAYAEFAAKTGTRLTFFINASYTSFEQNLDVLLPLVKSGQIQIANHTYNHPNLLNLDDKQVKEEFVRNEEEIMRLFGVSSKPYFRPPYGYYDDRVLKIAAKAGFSRPVLWEGTTGDEGQTTQRVVLKRTKKYMKPQRIMLGHLNYTTIISLLERIKELLDERGLVTVTLRDYYGEASEEELKIVRDAEAEEKKKEEEKRSRRRKRKIRTVSLSKATAAKPAADNSQQRQCGEGSPAPHCMGSRVHHGIIERMSSPPESRKVPKCWFILWCLSPVIVAESNSD
ncbi:uricase [Rothia aeria]|uniref:Uricase n=1 Tax=Rothia aeria TaxID=172042 RepID=A0A2Z5R0I6_9MICC|nr:uricase [Rothia aeria]